MKIDNRIANFVKVKNQSSAMEKIMEKKRDKDAVLFFRSMGFMPVVKIRRAFRPYWKLRSVFWKADAKKRFVDYLNEPFLTFYPLPSIYSDYWSAFDTRYERDYWSNSESVKISFQYIFFIDNEITLMNGKWKVATLDARVLSSAMVVVFSNTEFDRKPYAILYLDPTNTYTYTEWKDKKHMENVHSVDWDKDLGKEQSFLGYFSKGDVK